MARPLTGQREVFRRLQETNEARRQRQNEVREMGGLEPIPDPTPQERWSHGIRVSSELQQDAYHSDLVSTFIRRYSEAMAANLERSIMETVQEDRQSRMRTISEQMWTNDFIPAGTERRGSLSPYQSIYYGNPCTEIYMDTDVNVDMKKVYATTEEMRRQLRLEELAKKSATNNDYKFLLNKDEG